MPFSTTFPYAYESPKHDHKCYCPRCVWGREAEEFLTALDAFVQEVNQHIVLEQIKVAIRDG